jgi:hypothetical protein
MCKKCKFGHAENVNIRIFFAKMRIKVYILIVFSLSLKINKVFSKTIHN